jgi:hypothetical protein
MCTVILDVAQTGTWLIDSFPACNDGGERENEQSKQQKQAA